MSYRQTTTERGVAAEAQAEERPGPGTGTFRVRGWKVGSDAAVGACLVALAAIFYLTPWPLIYFPALAGVAVLTWWRPGLALGLVPLFCPFYMQPKHFGHPRPEFSAAEVFLLIDLLVAGLSLALPGRRAAQSWRGLRSSPLLAPAALFLLAAALSTVFAADRHQAIQAYRERILEPVGFFVLLLLYARSIRDWRLLFGSLIAAGLVLTVIALDQAGGHLGATLSPSNPAGRVEALYGSPNNLGLFLDRVLPVWLAVALAARLPARARWAAGTAGLLLILALLFTYSRGAWLAVAAGCLLVLGIRFPWGRWLALAGIVLAGVAVLAEGTALGHTLAVGHQATAQRRVEVWQASVRMLRHDPILGIGPDNFLHYYAPTRAEDRWQRICSPGLGYMNSGAGAEPCLSHPHNEILDFWLSSGILGLLSFVWIEVLFWRSALDLLPRTRRGKVLLAGSMGAMLATLIHGLVDQSYFLPDLALIFWLLCAFVSWLAYSRDTLQTA